MLKITLLATALVSVILPSFTFDVNPGYTNKKMREGMPYKYVNGQFIAGGDFGDCDDGQYLCGILRSEIDEPLVNKAVEDYVLAHFHEVKNGEWRTIPTPLGDEWVVIYKRSAPALSK